MNERERERDRVRRVVCEVGNPRKSRSGSVRALDPQNSKSVRGKRECACVSSEEVNGNSSLLIKERNYYISGLTKGGRYYSIMMC